ncbi:MAG: carbamoyltransferase HypF [Campylobacterota bacterium]
MESSEGFISKRLLITLRGIVQGVGFRPFVYRIAKRYGIRGYVTNTPEGVLIDAEGRSLEAFLHTLQNDLPPLARIDALEASEEAVVGHEAFEIRESRMGEGSTAIPLESALCNACEREMRDPSNRRYGYPFINCTDCGPRYTIMQIPPYDRVRTSMKHFAMCDACRAEYDDPRSRRFHAEPISCPECGPKLRLLDAAGNEIRENPIEGAARRLREGKIVALKGLGGFHLMCDATSEAAVVDLRRRKRRRAKPLAVMFASMEQLRFHARIDEDEAALIEGNIKPIVLVDADPASSLAPSVAPGIGRIGVFLPYTPLHRMLFESVDFPLVATSANISDEPILIRAEEVIQRLGDVVDAILDHDRSIVNGLDDAVVQVAGGKTLMLRMGRGYAPCTFLLPAPLPKPLLAVGAHQKSAVALGVGRSLVLGGHIGDLGSIEAEEYFERNVHTLERFYRCTPEVILHDAHPAYASTRYASQRTKTTAAVQHHYAHILACMAEHALKETVIGFSFDGTGYGENGTMWGGEVLIADVRGYERIGFIKPFALLGGDKAIKEPRRIALALLFERYSLDEVLAMDIPATAAFLPHEIRQLHHMWSKNLNAPRSSSMGRLFDAVASLGGFVQSLDYEGQGGLIMEGYVREREAEPFTFTIEEGCIDVLGMVDQIIALLPSEEAKYTIAGRFIATVSSIIETLASRYPDLPVVIGGGVFQNRALMSRLYRRFEGKRFYAQQRTPINDGSIALGQAWWGVHNV